jgi:Replication initiation factor
VDYSDYSKLALTPIEARMDWITCTAPHNDAGLELFWHGNTLVTAEESAGYKQEPWSFSGYRGYQSRHARYGWGSQGAIVVVSGELAMVAAPALADKAMHWSRADVCVTCRLDDTTFNPVDDYWTWIRDEHKGTRLARTHKRFQEMHGGGTYYVGQRSSAIFLRCYDKYRESKGDYPLGCWRWECELKRHLSEAMHRLWQGGSTTETYLADYVAMEWSRAELTVPWTPTAHVKRDPEVRHRPDAERKLAWMRENIAPSVKWTAQAVGIDKVLEALNLPHVSYTYPGPGPAKE